MKHTTFKTMAAAAVLATSTILATDASAAMIDGAIDIGGSVTVASTGDMTGVDFLGNGTVLGAAGDFTSIAPFTPVTMTDITFAAPGDIWSVGGFTFTATGFSNILANLQGGKDFTAVGTIAGNGFDVTDGVFNFSSQTSGVLASFSSSSITVAAVPLPASMLLLIGGLAGMGAVSRRRKAA